MRGGRASALPLFLCTKEASAGSPLCDYTKKGEGFGPPPSFFHLLAGLLLVL